MKILFRGTLFVILLIMQVSAFGQTNKETAKQKGERAVTLEDEGKFDDALKLLDEAIKLDPASIDYPYETAYCYYNQEKYDKVIDLLTKLKDRDDSIDRLYQLLGNSYDNIKQTDKAVAIYEEGLKKFPASGNLYLEMGVIPLIKKDYDKALFYFEKGIKAAPAVSSNYYWAAKLYCGSTEKMWGMIYGEIFINLERNSKRTIEISKLLFDTYKSQITFTSATSAKVSFSNGATIQVVDPKNIKLPYSIIYEPTLLIAIVNETSIDLNSLDRIRKKFVDFYFQKEFNKKYPNVLFDYQESLIKAGHMEAYNHWLLLKGDEASFNKWQQENKEKWDGFVTWFTANPLSLNNDKKFYREQY
ncbi:MAG TPA: tetratricopeptide repeat protein [Mucilaginibacter sp.]|nr:tetratricopeptide repeat protein [Mucilaginibacter sp.]